MATLTANYTVQIGESGPILGPDEPYVVTNVDGFGVPHVRTGDNPRPEDVGIYFGRDFIGARTVIVDVTVTGDDDADALTNFDALMAAWQLATPDSTAAMPLKLRLPGRGNVRVHGRPRDVSADLSNLNAGRIPCTLLFATDSPAILSDTLLTVTVGLAEAGAGRTYPRVYPLVYGAGASGGIIHATNAGNYASRPVVTIVGPCVNPKVEDVPAGAFMQCIISLASTDTLAIDFDARTILLNGANRYGTKTIDSTWWELAPGTSEVHFTANAFQAGATCTLAWRPAWLS